MASDPVVAGDGTAARLGLGLDLGHRLGREQIRAQMPV